ncbi:MAG: 3-hydroxyisobutyrate dehydrogenase, partial [Pseudonocardiales bacterium]|nr:3-hydroxyisobutyrate dehydrogenase [Pseudonocardiales bacterium]
MSDKPTVALLGTGIMGAGMGHNMLKAGLPLRVWNRSPEKAEPLVAA